MNLVLDRIFSPLKQVSVPLRGSGYESVKAQTAKTLSKFPSPCGVVGMNPDHPASDSFSLLVFVPLRGSGYESIVLC